MTTLREAANIIGVFTKQYEALKMVENALSQVSNLEAQVKEAATAGVKLAAEREAHVAAMAQIARETSDAQATLSDVKKQAAQHQREAMDNAGQIRDMARADAKSIVEKAVETAGAAVSKAKGEVDVATVKLTAMNNEMKVAEGLRDQFKKELEAMKARLL